MYARIFAFYSEAEILAYSPVYVISRRTGSVHGTMPLR